jgi:hypothetical protein
MLGLILFIIILGIAAAAVAQKQLAIPCQLQPRWWRVTPPGVTPLKTGTANSLFAVLRLAKQSNAKSFNYSYVTKTYQIFSEWLVNWTQPIDIVVTKSSPGQTFSYTQTVGHVTGAVGGPTDGVPSPCMRKVACEMAAHGMHPDGKSMRNWANAGVPKVDTNYYDVKAAAALWPTGTSGATEGVKVPPVITIESKKPFIQTALIQRLKASGQAINGKDAAGNITTAPPPEPCTEGACEFCGTNSTKEFWYGCNNVGALYKNASHTQTYSTPTTL